MHKLPPEADDLPGEIRRYLKPGGGIDRQLGRALWTSLREGRRCSTLEDAVFDADPVENQRIKDLIAPYMHSWVTSTFTEAITTIEIACGINPRP